jgi:hypothetical protein
MTTRDGTGPTGRDNEEKVMKTVNTEMSLKVVVCAMAALALTVMSSYSFVASTAKVRGGSNVTESLGEIVISSARQVAQNTSAVLVD